MTPPHAIAGALRYRVLLAEADAGDAELVQIWLRRAQETQYDLWQVESLGDAEGCLAKQEFDLALVDLSLPDAPGPWAYHALHERCPDLPIIVFSSFADAEVAKKLLADGAFDHLVKGQMSGDTLIRAMRHAIAFGSVKQELAAARSQGQAASHLRADLVAELAQDFRTPLHTVLGMADLLLETELTREQEGYVRSFSRASEGLLGRLDALLAEGQRPAAEEAEAPPVSEAPSAVRREPIFHGHVASGDRLRVLVVDDSDVAREETLAILREAEHDADPAPDGLVAAEMFREGDYDAVLMDLDMPLADGFSTTRLLRAIEEELGRDPVVVLALTGRSSEASVQACLEAGCDDHLRKPVDAGLLIEALARHAPKAHQRLLRVDGGAAEAVDHYLHERHNDLAALRFALEEDDFDSVRAVGQLLESSASRQGFRELTEIGRQIERAADAADASAVQAAAGRLTEFLREVKIVVRDA